MDVEVKKLFDRYERFFKKSLNGGVDTEQVASAYAPAFIAASPAGVMCGKNDEPLMHIMRQGYAHDRAIGGANKSDL